MKKMTQIAARLLLASGFCLEACSELRVATSKAQGSAFSAPLTPPPSIVQLHLPENLTYKLNNGVGNAVWLAPDLLITALFAPASLQSEFTLFIGVPSEDYSTFDIEYTFNPLDPTSGDKFVVVPGSNLVLMKLGTKVRSEDGIATLAPMGVAASDQVTISYYQQDYTNSAGTTAKNLKRSIQQVAPNEDQNDISINKNSLISSTAAEAIGAGMFNSAGELAGILSTISTDTRKSDVYTNIQNAGIATLLAQVVAAFVPAGYTDDASGDSASPLPSPADAANAAPPVSDSGSVSPSESPNDPSTSAGTSSDSDGVK